MHHTCAVTRHAPHMRRHVLCTSHRAIMRHTPHTMRHHASCTTHHAPSRVMHHTSCAVTRHAPHNAPSRAMHHLTRRHVLYSTQCASTHHASPPSSHRTDTTFPTTAKQAARRNDSDASTCAQHKPKQTSTNQNQVWPLPTIQRGPRTRIGQSPKRRKRTQRQAVQHTQENQGGQ
jgi:hypothetical protein